MCYSTYNHPFRKKNIDEFITRIINNKIEEEEEEEEDKSTFLRFWWLIKNVFITKTKITIQMALKTW